ncbi:hypothetical protein [Ponticoccus litoralis]|uniref:DUF1902 domain-containing protein n=1 Tax=Ponticoccus litoralis TaxID=422297 RepID=A0AAW9SKQ4_9RHOB
MYLITYTAEWRSQHEGVVECIRMENETREARAPGTLKEAVASVEDGLLDIRGVESVRVIHADVEAGICADVTDLVLNELRSIASSESDTPRGAWMHEHPALFPFGFGMAAE